MKNKKNKIRIDIKNINYVKFIKNMMVISELETKPKKGHCLCNQWEDLCLIEMTRNTFDYIFGVMEKLKKREELLYGPSLKKCKICNEYWLVVQDDAILDSFFLNRLNLKQANDIIENDIWPDIFSYENILKMGAENGIRYSFADPINSSPFNYIIEGLAMERPFIKISELSKLLNIRIETARLLSNRAIENNASVKITFDE